MTTIEDARTPLTLKDEGNEFFKLGKYEEAIEKYSEAIKLTKGSVKDHEIFLKNRAACYLKLEKYDKTIEDCSSILGYNPYETKALYRRSQAYESQSKFELAFLDIKNILHVEPKNKSAIVSATRLSKLTIARSQKGMSDSSAAQDMIDILQGKTPSYAKGNKVTKDIKQQALNNIAALASTPKCDELVNLDVVSQLISFLDRAKKPREEEENIALAFAALASLAKHARHAELIYKSTVDLLGTWVCSSETEYRRGGFNIYISIASHDKDPSLTRRLFEKGVQILNEANALESSDDKEKVLDDIVNMMMKSLTDHNVIQFLNSGPFFALLELASSSKIKGSSDSFSNEKLRVALAINKLTDIVFGDEDIADLKTETAESYKKKLVSITNNGMKAEDDKQKIAGLNVLSTIFSASTQIGNWLADETDIIKALIGCCESNNVVVQVAAAEVLAQAATNKGMAAKILTEGAAQLQVLYNSEVDAVLVRVMVALAKIATITKTAEGVEILGEGGFEGLFLSAASYMDQHYNVGIQRWAIEAMAYLTLNPDLKEEFAHSKDCVKTVMTIGKTTTDKALVYAIISIIQNVTNSLPKKELTEEQKEMLKLKKYAKEHVPDDHEFDKDEYVRSRAIIFVEAGLIPALVQISKVTHDSLNTMDSIARILKTVSEDQKYRGQIVAAGGHIPLLYIANNAKIDTMNIASQALAKIAITSNPALVFPGQKSLELVRPLVRLLEATNELLTFESLLALTNLASSDDPAIRKRIVAEDGIYKISQLQLDDNEMVQRAATECLCNLLFEPEIFHMYVTKDGKRFDDLTLWLLLSGSEDIACASAASAGLAMMTQEICVCDKIIENKSCFNIVTELFARNDVGLLKRGIVIVQNIINSKEENAKKYCDSENSVEVLVAIAQNMLPTKDADSARQAQECLAKLVQYNLIQPNNQRV